MLKPNLKQMSYLSFLYDRIPGDHILKKIDAAIDFSFLNDLLKSSYCENFGRPAKEPEMMAKLCILEYLYNLSDKKVIEEAGINLAFLWFLGLNPDEDLPDPSLLAKFRTQRLKNTSIDEIMNNIVKQCVDKGIIKGKTIAVDATHTEANCKKKIPERIMRTLASKIIEGVRKDNNGQLPEGMDEKNIPEVEGHNNKEEGEKAKASMKAFLEETISKAREYAGEETAKAIEVAEKVLSDESFLIQKGQRSLTDPDARVGYKSKTDPFFGYKVEYAMTTDERIITSITTENGAYVDGNKFDKLLENTQKSGVDVQAVTADKGYFRKPILDKLKEENIESIIPVSPSVYRIDESKFSYNKDSDEWICPMNKRSQYRTTVIHRQKHRPETEVLRYFFSKEDCNKCPLRAECMGKDKGGRKLNISVNTPEYYAESQRQKTEEFKEKYRRRASIEWKNAEMKLLHRLSKARGWGIHSMRMQAFFTAMAVNLKRIAALIRIKRDSSAILPPEPPKGRVLMAS